MKRIASLTMAAVLTMLAIPSADAAEITETSKGCTAKFTPGERYSAQQLLDSLNATDTKTLRRDQNAAIEKTYPGTAIVAYRAYLKPVLLLGRKLAEERYMDYVEPAAVKLKEEIGVPRELGEQYLIHEVERTRGYGNPVFTPLFDANVIAQAAQSGKATLTTPQADPYWTREQLIGYAWPEKGDALYNEFASTPTGQAIEDYRAFAKAQSSATQACQSGTSTTVPFPGYGPKRR